MRKNVYIAGMGLTEFGELYERSMESLMHEATLEALDSAGLKAEELDAVFIGNMLGGELSSQSHLSSVLSELLNINCPIVRVENACASGGVAAHLAREAVAHGVHGRVLALGVEKMTDHDSASVNSCLMHAAAREEREAGLSFVSLYALMAQAYALENKLSESDLRTKLNQWSSKMHENACGFSKAQFKKIISPEEVGQSPILSEPLRLLDCSPISDGAAAIVLSAEQNEVELKDSVLASDAAALSQRSIQHGMPAVRRATELLFGQNDLDISSIDVLELHDCFSITGLIALQDLGVLDPESKQINAWGGLKAFGHPVAATGIRQIISAAKTLQKDQWALTHNVGGTGATAVLHLLRRN